jgi:predicted aldo/keto reductase-like oxidoreductase
MAMKYRSLGKTGMKVSVIGLGTGPLGSSTTDYAVRVVNKALEMGVNYFDTARSYWDSELKLGVALKGVRQQVYVSSKTGARTRADAWRHIQESLERLQTDYLDNYHLHHLRDDADTAVRLGPGGALEALIEAKQQGLIRHIGCTSHHPNRVLVSALKQYDFEVILVPMNIVETGPLDELIPLCQRKGVGVSIMKPLATGLLPAGLALKWLSGQPIATATPGATTVEEVEENSRVGHLRSFALAPGEVQQVDDLRAGLGGVRCRICSACEPCHVGIPIAVTLGTDVMFDHYRTMGREAFAAFPWSDERVRGDIESRRQLIAKIAACDNCGACEERCPYHLPIVKMLRASAPMSEDMIRIWQGASARV